MTLIRQDYWERRPKERLAWTDEDLRETLLESAANLGRDDLVAELSVGPLPRARLESLASAVGAECRDRSDALKALASRLYR